MYFPTKTFIVMALTVGTNAILWLDSFDRYMSSRYHMNLSLSIPEWLFTPSRVMQDDLIDKGGALLASPLESVEAAVSRPESIAVPAVEPVLPIQASSSAVMDSEEKREPVAALPEEPPRILFAGDSMMQGVAPLVISKLKKDYPQATLVDVSKQSTGLTVRRYFDWPTKIREEATKRDIKAVVIFLGPNDPWDITEDKKRYVFPSQEWEDKYRARVVEVLQFAADRKMRIVWIGLPAMKNDRVRRGAVIQNRVFREECMRFGFDYLDTEEFLGRLDQPFNKYIPDEKKGQVLVRADDGTHFTPYGLRLIAGRLLSILDQRQQRQG